MGGMIAQLVALNHPEKSRSLISIFSTTSDPSLPPSSKEAAEALTARPLSTDRETVVAHSVKGRRSLKLPTLVLHGSADTLLRPEGGRHTAQCIADSEYHEVEGWGHDMPLPAIPVIAGLIVPFVRKVEAVREAAAA